MSEFSLEEWIMPTNSCKERATIYGKWLLLKKTGSYWYHFTVGYYIDSFFFSSPSPTPTPLVAVNISFISYSCLVGFGFGVCICGGWGELF